MKTYHITLRLRTTAPTPALVQLWLTQIFLDRKKDLGRGGSVTIESLTEEPKQFGTKKQRRDEPQVGPVGMPVCPEHNQPLHVGVSENVLVCPVTGCNQTKHLSTK